MAGETEKMAGNYWSPLIICSPANSKMNLFLL